MANFTITGWKRERERERVKKAHVQKARESKCEETHTHKAKDEQMNCSILFEMTWMLAGPYDIKRYDNEFKFKLYHIVPWNVFHSLRERWMWNKS